MSKTLKTVPFSTEKGGIRPTVRESIKNQSISHLGLDLSALTKMPDGRLGMPVAIDELSGDNIYLLVNVSVGFEPLGKTKKSNSKASEPVTIGNLFD